MLRLLAALFVLFIFAEPVYAQDGLTDGERIARIEARLDTNEQHLATKADLEKFHGELSVEIANVNDNISESLSTVRATVGTLQWVVGIAIAAAAVIASALNIGLTLWMNRK